MFGVQGENTVGLTGADLEEEALLILIRREHEAVSRGGGDGRRTDMSGSLSCQNTAVLLQQFQQQLELVLDSSTDDNDKDDDADSDDHDTHDVKTGNGNGDNSAVAGATGASSGSKKRRIQSNVVIRVIKLWLEHVAKTLHAVVDSHERATSRDISNDGEISIVITKPSVSNQTKAIESFFVRWHNPEEFEGRVVRVDEQNRVVWSPSTLFGKPIPTQIFGPTGYDILVSAAGAKCLKQKGSGRDIFPPTIVRFVHLINMLAISWNEDMLGDGWARIGGQ